jgi:hypothetical protein
VGAAIATSLTVTVGPLFGTVLQAYAFDGCDIIAQANRISVTAMCRPKRILAQDGIRKRKRMSIAEWDGTLGKGEIFVGA